MFVTATAVYSAVASTTAEQGDLCICYALSLDYILATRRTGT